MCFYYWYHNIIVNNKWIALWPGVVLRAGVLTKYFSWSDTSKHHHDRASFIGESWWSYGFAVNYLSLVYWHSRRQVVLTLNLYMALQQHSVTQMQHGRGKWGIFLCCRMSLVLRFSDWINAAHSVLHIPEAVAAVYVFCVLLIFILLCRYFELFEYFQNQNASAVLQKTREQLSLPSADVGAWDSIIVCWTHHFTVKQLQQHTTVPLYEFLLFLFVQLYSRSTPRSRKVFGTDDVYESAFVVTITRIDGPKHVCFHQDLHQPVERKDSS